MHLSVRTVAVSLFVLNTLICSYAFVVGSNSKYLTIATDPRLLAGKVALNAKQV